MDSNKTKDRIEEETVEFYLTAPIGDLMKDADQRNHNLNTNNAKRNKFAKFYKFKAKAELQSARNIELINKARKQLSTFQKNYGIKSLVELKNLLTSRGLSFQFRNIDKLDSESLIDMIQDIDVILLIEKLKELDDDKAI